jgi:hypothetical protein
MLTEQPHAQGMTPAQTLEQLSQSIDPKWARMDPVFVISVIREKTSFDADLIEAMLQFAIDAAALAAPEAAKVTPTRYA